MDPAAKLEEGEEKEGAVGRGGFQN